MDCWGCERHATTGLDGFVYNPCAFCWERERTVTENLDKCHAIANGENARKRDNPEFSAKLTAEVRAAWPAQADFLKWRSSVWTLIKAREAKGG
jgi:hypothetical protein